MPNATGNEAVRLGLEKFRARLLDLTNRNQLLNYRRRKASLEFVDSSIDATFELLLDGGRVQVEPVPEPDRSPHLPTEEGGNSEGLAKPKAAEHAKEIGWRPELDLLGDVNRLPPTLRVLSYVDELESSSRKIASAAKTAIEESGTNILHLVLGFLEWYESDDSDQARLAPLVVIPVAIDRKAGRGRGFGCAIEHSGEDLATNESLIEKLKVDFDVDLPRLGDEETPQSYFSRVETTIGRHRRWRVRRQMTLSLLSFGKLLMYRDIAPALWPGILEHQTVREIFDGRNVTDLRPAGDYLIDDLVRRKEYVPHIVLDADSSQHSALVDALNGKNLVIEGPPGTGKSQTIANLIAAAIASNKTVLFVAEKLAALEVVRRRLDDAELGLFCLELHSHKTRKDALLGDLGRRVRKRFRRADSDEFDAQLRAVERTKKSIVRYAGMLQRKHETFDATLQELIWKRERHNAKIGLVAEALDGLRVPRLMSYTPSQFSEAEDQVADYARHLAAVLEDRATPDEHPWAWIRGSLDPAQEERIVDGLRNLKANGKVVANVCQRMNEVGIEVPATRDGWQALADLRSRLPNLGGDVDDSLLLACRDPGVRTALLTLATDVSHARACLQRLTEASLAGGPAKLLDVGAEVQVEVLLEGATELGLANRDPSGLSEVAAQLEGAEQFLARAAAAFDRICTSGEVSIPRTAVSTRILLEAVRCLEQAPVDDLHLRRAGMEAEGAGKTVRRAAERALELREKRETLGQWADLTTARDSGAAELKKQATVLVQAGLWQRLFGSDFRHARRLGRGLSRQGLKVDRHETGRRLRELGEFLESVDEFAADPESREAVGPSIDKGIDADWPGLLRLAEWYRLVFEKLPGTDPVSNELRRPLFERRTETLRGWRKVVSESEAEVELLRQFASGQAAQWQAAAAGQPEVLDGQLAEVKARLERVRTLIIGLQSLNVASHVVIDSLPELLDCGRQLRAALAELEGNIIARQALGESFQGLDTKTDVIVSTAQFAQHASEALSGEALDRVLSTEGAEALESARKALDHVAECVGRTDAILADLDIASNHNHWRDGARRVDTLAAEATALLDDREGLVPWRHFQRSRAWISEAGLDELGALAETGRLPVAQLSPAFGFVFYSTLIWGMCFDDQDFQVLDGAGQEKAREKFIAADRRAIEIYRQYAASLVARRSIPSGNGTGPVRAYTELALINHELRKQKRHLPIRQLVNRAGLALQAMKPCFMMGPLSVAQFFEPGKLTFDIVVMDEASQLKPEDAIGAVARGSQLVVVGDAKQLPPSSFFERAIADEMDEDEGGAAQTESILDLASGLYQPSRRLKWHYRSRHHSLIAYSNREFYESELMVVPSPADKVSHLGIVYRQVNAGCFESRRNRPEAREVAAAVLEHVRSNPNESLGVVALNFEQREEIEDLLDRELREDPAGIAYQESMELRGEPLFVKNLENVQGDERDVVFVSCTYGPDESGAQFQRFGPINSAVGHRRLNVLFTRAKNRVEVFSSLNPDKIRTDGASRGVRVLKEYLTFARDKVLPDSVSPGDGPTNDFEQAVGSILADHGYEIAYQVGVAGFFIDIAVRNPAKPGMFVLGIECDGALYHSTSSARDRDRLRQEILEQRGWVIHRVWSTDWYKARRNTVDRLLAAVESALSKDPEYRAFRQRRELLEGLRGRLEALRDDEIRPAFPDSTEEVNLLRGEMLELFLEKKPIDRDQWFRFPEDLRSATEPRQVGRFLDRVLAVIREATY